MYWALCLQISASHLEEHGMLRAGSSGNSNELAPRQEGWGQVAALGTISQLPVLIIACMSGVKRSTTRREANFTTHPCCALAMVQRCDGLHRHGAATGLAVHGHPQAPPAATFQTQLLSFVNHACLPQQATPPAAVRPQLWLDPAVMSTNRRAVETGTGETSAYVDSPVPTCPSQLMPLRAGRC